MTGSSFRSDRRRGGRWTTLWGGAVVTIFLALSGCSGEEPEIADSTAQSLQAGVVSIAEAAAAGDITTAITNLATVEALLAEGLAADTINADRGAEIQAAIELVRKDLAAASQPAEPSSTSTPVPPPESASTPTVIATEEPQPETSEPTVTHPPSPTAPVPAVTEAPLSAETTPSSPGNSGNGNGNNGSGNGNSNNGNNGNGNGNSGN